MGWQLVANRAWWGYFEFLAVFIHMAAGAFGTLMHFILAFLRQFMRVSRLGLYRHNPILHLFHQHHPLLPFVP